MWPGLRFEASAWFAIADALDQAGLGRGAIRRSAVDIAIETNGRRLVWGGADALGLRLGTSLEGISLETKDHAGTDPLGAHGSRQFLHDRRPDRPARENDLSIATRHAPRPRRSPRDQGSLW